MGVGGKGGTEGKNFNGRKGGWEGGLRGEIDINNGLCLFWLYIKERRRGAKETRTE